MTLPPFAVNAAQLMAWAMARPEEETRDAVRFLTVTTADPHTINRWAEALSRLQDLAADNNGPPLSLDDYIACIAWVAEAAHVHPDAHSSEVKRAVFDEALQLHSP